MKHRAKEEHTHTMTEKPTLVAATAAVAAFQEARATLSLKLEELNEQIEEATKVRDEILQLLAEGGATSTSSKASPAKKKPAARASKPKVKEEKVEPEASKPGESSEVAELDDWEPGEDPASEEKSTAEAGADADDLNFDDLEF